MSTVGIMTWLHNGNYGTVLQAYALQQYLRKQGYSVTNIDFNASTTEKVKNLLYRGNSAKLFLEKFDIAMTQRSADSEKQKVKERRFQEFINNNFNLTKRISTYKSLSQYSDCFESYVCGSDQIWSPVLLNTPYYFDFVSDNRKKIAYACSFGVSSVPLRKSRIITELLKRYDRISVREQNGQKIIKDLIGVDVPTTVDPVFLLDDREWDKIAKDSCIAGEYVFAYFLTYNSSYIELAKKVARKLDVKLVMVPVTKEEYNVEAELAQDVGPAEWIGLIKNAKVVLTDSFHGCVFSLLYEKPILIFKRFADSNKESQNSRIYTLIKQYGLQDRLVDITTYDFDGLDSIEKSIRLQIEMNSQVSKKWLIDSLEV